MILKVELAYDKNLGARWRFFENLEEVEYTLMVYDPDVHTGFNWYILTDEDRKLEDVMSINCKKSNGNGLSIVTQRSVYLLNDNGKTIERIY